MNFGIQRLWRTDRVDGIRGSRRSRAAAYSLGSGQKQQTMLQRIIDAFARGAATAAAANWANRRMQPMIQRLMWTRQIGNAELALIDVAWRGKSGYQLYAIIDEDWMLLGEFRRYADAWAAVQSWVGYFERGGTAKAWLAPKA